MKGITKELEKTIQGAINREIRDSRKKKLGILIKYVLEKFKNNQDVNFNFICTHNSRRSQFCQIWSHTASHYFNVPVNSHSGGIEITECNELVISSIKNSGFLVSSNSKNKNPEYSISIGDNYKTLKMFSKLFNKSINSDISFAAVMVCSDADKNCPYIPGAEKLISLPYDDPKVFDDTPHEIKKYEECSHKIASEIFYVFNEVSKKLSFIN